MKIFIKFAALFIALSKGSTAKSLRGNSTEIENAEGAGRNLGWFSACGRYEDGCWAADPCCDGYSCQPVIHKCYHEPRRYREPCSLGYSCGAGLSCQPGHHKCYHSPRREGEPCSLGYECGGDLTCEAGTHVCRRPGALGDSCHATRPCGDGLSCQPGHHKCYHSPRREEEPCSLGYECGGDLTCEAGTHVCRKPGKGGDPCHATRPCGKGFKCMPFVHECYPAGIDLDSDLDCSSYKWDEISDDARELGATMSFGTGFTSNVGLMESVESGTVYGENGEYSCYVSVCYGLQTDVSISSYGIMGVFNSWGAFPGEAVVIGAGVNTPVVEVGYGTGSVHNTDMDLIGSVHSLSIGVGISPVQASGSYCYTAISDEGAVNMLNEMKDDAERLAKALYDEMT